MNLALKFETLAQALYFEAKVAGPSRGVTFIDDRGGEELVSYLQALEEGSARAGALQRLGVQPREPVMVILPTSPDFMYVFFGLMFAGAIPAPLSPPTTFADMDGFVARVAMIARYLGAKRLITTEALGDLLRAGLPEAELIIDRALQAEPPAGEPVYSPVQVGAHDCAFIQCTSGSTGASKGVMLTHENLISNIYQIGWCLDVKADTAVVCWLPLYHDMGLIGCLLFSIYWNLNAVFMSPHRFLRRPATWLQALSKFRGVISPAPNFAYGYTTGRVKDSELDGVELSSFTHACCGAEPIEARTLDAFEERFASWGLAPSSVVPCYGLAEATLAVTFHEGGTPRIRDRVDREAMALTGEVRDVGPDDPRGVDIVSCGRPMPESRVRIVDEAWQPLPENQVGRVQVMGPSVMKGYYRLPDKTAEVLRDGWLDTGDLGYLREGALRVTGRVKDLIIIRGRNYLPSEFEWAADEVEGVRRGNVIAFGQTDPLQGTEVLCLALETDLTEREDRAQLVRDVRAHVAARTGIAPARVELVPRGGIPKTSSGKLQRSRMKQALLDAPKAGA